MTDPHDLDDLASAHLDGATTPEEAAVVEADPSLLARVEELRAVRAAVAEVPPVDATVRERAISAALAAFDDGEHPDATVAAVHPLAPRRGLSPRTVGALGAAAAVVLLALLVPLLADRSGDDDETASLEETGSTLGGDAAPSVEGEAAPEPGSAAAGGGSATGSDALATLGAYEDLDALAAAVAAPAAQERGAGDQSSADLGTPLCQPGPAGGTLFGVASVAGQDVVVYVSSIDGTDRIIVLERGTCERVGERALPSP